MLRKIAQLISIGSNIDPNSFHQRIVQTRLPFWKIIMRSVVITGSSSGIGQAIAQRLAEKNWNVFAGVRNDKDADRLRNLNRAIKPLYIDVTNVTQLEDAAKEVDRSLDGNKLTGLVNNAGIAQMGPITLQPMDEIKAHFDINTLGTISACQVFAPLLGQDRSRIGPSGRIINITSLGGEIASPFLGAYTATKHALESVTDTLRRELSLFGIDCIAVGPGAVQTPIWEKAREKRNPVYENSPWSASLDNFLTTMVEAGHNGLSVDKIAEVVDVALTASRPKARYAPVPKKIINYYLLRVLPKRWVDKIFIRKFGIEYLSH